MKLRDDNIIVCDCGAELNPEITTAQDYITYNNETKIASCSYCLANEEIIFLTKDLTIALNEKGFITCTQLGMVSNDDTQALTNRIKLIGAMNLGVKIFVDDKYYISCDSGSGTVVDKSIYLQGITSNAEICFTDISIRHFVKFTATDKNIFLEKIKFSTQNTSITTCIWVFSMWDNIKINKIKMENCEFEGNLRLLTWDFTDDTYLDPTIIDFGIDSLIFKSNKAKNITSLYKGFVYIGYTPVRYAEVVFNDIHNFCGVFWEQSFGNNCVYLNQISEAMEFLKVENNTVINDITWNGVPFGIDQTYHCFILFTGNRCEYRNNYVEGLHTFDQVDIGLYDAYLTCYDLVYENNYWKNNINFTLTKSYNDLMKAKSYHKKSYFGIRRVYKNNTWIVEKSYADIINNNGIIGRPYDELWVILSEYQSEIDTVIVENNTIDVYKIYMPYNQQIHNYFFNNNTIHAYGTMTGKYHCLVPLLSYTKTTDISRAGSSNTIILSSSSHPSDDYYNNCVIYIASGTGIGQYRLISDYNGTTKVAIVSTNWIINPNNMSVYEIFNIIASGTAQAGSVNSIILGSGASIQTNLYKGYMVCITDGTGVGQSAFITAYDGTTKIATVSPNWTTNPDNTSVYSLVDMNGRYECKGNNIIFESKGDGLDYSRDWLIHSNIGGYCPRKVIFEDNYIEWHNLYGFIGNATGASRITIIELVKMIGNNMVTKRPGSSGGKTLYCDQFHIIRNLIFDNTVEIANSDYIFYPTPAGGHEYMDYHLVHCNFSVSSSAYRFIDLAYNNNKELLGSAKYYNHVHLKCLHSAGEEDFYFNFTHYYSFGDYNCVDYIKSDDSIVTGQALDGGGTNNNSTVKLVGTASKFAISFKNNGADRGFYLANNIPTDELCVIEVTIKQSKKG